MRCCKRTTLGFALVALLSGCATIRDDAMPSALLEACPHPVVDTRTNGGLAKGLRDYKDALSQCNIDKAILREWQKDRP